MIIETGRSLGILLHSNPLSTRLLPCHSRAIYLNSIRLDPPRSGLRRSLMLFSLVLAGEAIYGLPFHVTRYFRPAFLEVFDLTQTQLGILGSLYGFVAMVGYLIGGGLADWFPARGLLVFSLLGTGATGFFMASIPSFPGLCLLYALWGILTVLPFWSALIRATREWGGLNLQGTAFGLLDGGRGLLAALWAMIALWIFASWLPDGGVSATSEQRVDAVLSAIYLYTAASVLAAGCCWLFLPPMSRPPRDTSARVLLSGHLIEAIRRPRVWLQAAVVFSAYSAFKGLDYFSQFARDIWEWSDVQAAGLSAFSSWMRPIGAIGAGLLADRSSPSRVVIGSFVFTGVAYVGMVVAPPGGATVGLLWGSVLICSLGFFALRGVYFALLEETKIPLGMTGTAVGVVSFLGFTPEIVMPFLGGWLIDHWSGEARGYHVLYLFLAVVSLLGMVAAALLQRGVQSSEDGLVKKLGRSFQPRFDRDRS